MTNHHVIDQCEITKVNFKGEEIEAKTLAIDKTNDLAIIKAEINPDKFIQYPMKMLLCCKIYFPLLGKKVSSYKNTQRKCYCSCWIWR